MAVLVPFRGMSELATTGCIFTDWMARARRKSKSKGMGKGGRSRESGRKC